MNLELTIEQATELKSLLEASLGDLRYEIAATDNAHFRESLRARHELLVGISEKLATLSQPGPVPVDSPSPALYQELAHPGG